MTSYLFIPYGSPNPLYGVGWTLNFEMLFYAVFSICLLFRKAAALALLAGILLIAVIIGQYVALPLTLVVWTSPIVVEFLAGAGIALLFQRGVKLPSWLRAALGLSALGVIGLYGNPTVSAFPELDTWRFLYWGGPAAAILAASVLGPQGWLDGPLGRVAKPLGDASYSLYLLHILVLHYFVPPAFAQHQPLYIVAGFVTAVALSLVTYRYFERPITTVLKRPFLSGRERSRSTLAPLGTQARP